MAKNKLKMLQQTVLAMTYLTKFQIWVIQTNWNKKALIVKYRRGLKPKVQDVLILMEDTEDIKTLIN